MNRAIRHTRRARRGFTLVELLVAMVAGLLVSLAVIALSREATFSFHEEMRSASAEMSTRTALDRLRSDLQRAGFMSTGNIRADLRVPLDPRGAQDLTRPGIAALAGINYRPKGSLAATPLSGAGDNALEPDAIDLSGNFTTSDTFVVSHITPGGGCGVRLWLSKDSAATYRLMSVPAADRDATIDEIFRPAPATFAIRVADDLGRHEFFTGCTGGAKTAGFDGTTFYVDIQGSASYLEQAYGFVDGRLTVNPVHTVRWEIRPLKASDTRFGALTTDPGADGGVSSKYNLVRSWIDVEGDVYQPEVIAEFAVDLKFGFTADRGQYLAAPTPQMESYPFGAAANTSLAAGNGAGTQPQRIRSVRVRFSTRSSVPDRVADQRLPTNNYTIRYCLEESGCTAGSRQWARVRTMTTEVALPNLARLFY